MFRNELIIRKTNRNHMKKTYFILFLLLYTVCMAAATKDNNVTIVLHLDKYIRGVKQELYCYNENNDELISLDSVTVEPNKDTCRLHAYVPDESKVYILFSKRGPLPLEVVAIPNDTLEVTITQADDQPGLYRKPMIKGSAHQQELIDLWNKLMGEYREKDCTELFASYINHSESPVVIDLCLTLSQGKMEPFVWQKEVKIAQARFPKYGAFKKYLTERQINKIESPEAIAFYKIKGRVIDNRYNDLMDKK